MRLFIAGLPFAFRLPPQQTSKDTHKNLTLRLCSYINLFSCQISSYGSVSLRRLSGYELPWLPVLPFIQGLRSKTAAPLRSTRAYTALAIAYLATYAQRKMELNNHCSPRPAQCSAPKTTNANK
jgi:hypothetical protein